MRGRVASIINDIPTPDSVFGGSQILCARRKYSNFFNADLSADPTGNTYSGRVVRICLVFIRIGEIDTLNEKYQADIYYEARWIDYKKVESLKIKDQQRSDLLRESVTIRLDSYSPQTNWTPQLFIENEIAQIGELEEWFTVTKISAQPDERIPDDAVKLEICKHRRLRGVFWEKLELNHFPVDVQDLTISITSNRHSDAVELVQDEDRFSIINREAFLDQQEWKLYEHVAVESRETTEDYTFEQENGIEPKMHPVLAFTCRAARQPGYYYWNAFCLIFLVTVCAFCIFSIPPNLPQNRLQITSTLLLTSVTFRWVVNRSLPTISYLTTLDKYAIISIFILVILCVWHAIIAGVTFLQSSTLAESLKPNNKFVLIDRYVFFILFAAYILFHVGLFIWLMLVPYKRRRDMRALDRDFKKNLEHKLEEIRRMDKNGRNRNLLVNNLRRLSTRSNGSVTNKPSASPPIKVKPNALFVPNSPKFIAINEKVRGQRTSENSSELHN